MSRKVDFNEHPIVNCKGLFHFLCQTMVDVKSGETDVQTATAISKLASNAVGIMRNEIERGKLIELCSVNGRKAQIREVEGAGFDDTTTKFRDRTPYVIEQQ